MSEQDQLTALALACRSAEMSGRFQILWEDDSADDRRACLTLGFPDAASSAPRCGDDQIATGRRLVWWPDGITRRRRVAVISSRTGARHDQHVWWYDLLRTAVLRINATDECLATVSHTTAHDAAQRAAWLFGIPRLTVRADDQTVDPDGLVTWLAERIHAGRSKDDRRASQPDTWHAEVGPVLHNEAQRRGHQLSSGCPDRDVVQCSIGDRSYVLSCRAGGHVAGQLLLRLNSSETAKPLILVARGAGAPAGSDDRLVEAGAVPWLVDGVTSDRLTPSAAAGIAAASTELTDGPLAQPRDWLCHWTRPCFGAWPDQSPTDYLDELLLRCDTADRSGLAALLRIVSQRVVLASVIRHQLRAVSFTEVPLSEFRERRVYRRHRRRYDFEPRGVAVRRSALEGLGARRVVYGSPQRSADDGVTNSIWFQPATDQRGQIDWRLEQEWRLADDLRLDQLPANAVCLFTDSPAEADIVRSYSSWPVLVLPVSEASGS